MSQMSPLGREWRWMDPASEVDPSLLHVSFLLVPRLLVVIDFIFKSEPRVSSFQTGIVILSGIHKKWLASDRFDRNTKIIGSVRFLTRVVKKGSVCDRSDQIQALKLKDHSCSSIAIDMTSLAR